MSVSYTYPVVPPEALFRRPPAQWIAEHGCECVSAGVGVVNSVVTKPEMRTSGVGIIPGLTPEESALLAALLAALLTFLLLLIPILWCLTPLCGWCGGRKKKHRHANMARSENESFWSTGTFGKGTDYDHLRDNTIRLPRPYVDHPLPVKQIDDDGSWEGIDVDDVKIRNHIEPEVNKSREVMEAIGGQSRRSSMAPASTVGTVGKNSGEELITEYTTTRRVDMTINGGVAQEGSGGYYGPQSPEVLQDSFMKVYYSYNNDHEKLNTPY